LPQQKHPAEATPSEELAHEIAELALSKKADNIQILDVREQTTITDFFLICAGSTDVHVKAIHDAILDGMASVDKPWHVEGMQSLRWVLIDFVHVVVHIFQQEARDFYQLERLWADATLEIIGDSHAEASAEE